MKTLGYDWNPWSEHWDDQITHLHHWNPMTHPEYHGVTITKSYVKPIGQFGYRVSVCGGAYGEIYYLDDYFLKAGEARKAIKKAVELAIKNGHLKP